MSSVHYEPQNVASILSESYRLYKTIIKSALPYSILAECLLFSALHLQHHHSEPLLALHALCYLTAVVILSALIFRIYCHGNQIPLRFIPSLQHAIGKIVPLLFLSILYSLIVLSGTMLMIFPGLFLLVNLMFCFVLLITSHQSVLQTLVHSHHLVKGHWWHTLTTVALPVLLNANICLILMLGITLGATQYGWSTLFCTFSLSILLFGVQIFFLPFIFSVVLVLLEDLRHRTSPKQYKYP